MLVRSPPTAPGSPTNLLTANFSSRPSGLPGQVIHRAVEKGHCLFNGLDPDRVPVTAEIELRYRFDTVAGAGHGQEHRPRRLAVLRLGAGHSGDPDAPAGRQPVAYSAGQLQGHLG